MSRRRAATTRGRRADDLEQLDEALAHGALAVGVELREQREQAIERVLDVAAREVEVGDVELRVARSSGGGRRGVPDLVERLALQAPEQVRLREPGDGEGVARVLRDGGAVRGCRGLEVAALDRVVRLLVQRRQRLLDGLGRAVGGRRLAAGLDPSRDAVLGGELEELVEDLLDHVVGLHAGEQRHGLAGDHGDDRGDRLRLERLHQLRAPVGIGGSEHESAAARADEPVEGRESAVDCSLHDAQSATMTGTVRESSSVDPNAASSVSKTIAIPARRRAASAAAAGVARAPTGRPRRAGRWGDGVGHGISDAPMRLSDQPSRRICSSVPTPGT